MIEPADPQRGSYAHMMDTVENRTAKAEIAMVKVPVPNMAHQVIDWAIQAAWRRPHQQRFRSCRGLRHSAALFASQMVRMKSIGTKLLIWNRANTILLKADAAIELPFRSRDELRLQFALEHLAVIVLRQKTRETVFLRSFEACDLRQTVRVQLGSGHL
jgi:hypothetical protein